MGCSQLLSKESTHCRLVGTPDKLPHIRLKLSTRVLSETLATQCSILPPLLPPGHPKALPSPPAPWPFFSQRASASLRRQSFLLIPCCLPRAGTRRQVQNRGLDTDMQKMNKGRHGKDWVRECGWISANPTHPVGPTPRTCPTHGIHTNTLAQSLFCVRVTKPTAAEKTTVLDTVTSASAQSPSSSPS